MTAISGRDLIVRVASTPVAAVRATSVSLDNGPVDITTKDSNGFRTLGAFSGTRALNITLEGVWTDQVISDIAYGADSGLILTDVEIDDGTDTITCNFFVASFERAGNHDGEVTYSAEFQSSGEWSIAPNA